MICNPFSIVICNYIAETLCIKYIKALQSITNQFLLLPKGLTDEEIERKLKLIKKKLKKSEALGNANEDIKGEATWITL